MKEAIAVWKQRLVHLDLFIICFQSKAAGLHAACYGRIAALIHPFFYASDIP